MGQKARQQYCQWETLYLEYKLTTPFLCPSANDGIQTLNPELQIGQMTQEQ
jgi:hypothetical protein